MRCVLPLQEVFDQSNLLHHTDYDSAPFRGGGGGVIGATMLGLLDRDPLAGLELPESPPLPLPNGRALLAAECGRSCCREGGPLQGRHTENLNASVHRGDGAAGAARQL